MNGRRDLLRFATGLLTLQVTACGASGEPEVVGAWRLAFARGADGGPAGDEDAGSGDLDAGVGGEEGGVSLDDAGTLDAAAQDAGAEDGGPVEDGGSVDAGAEDGGTIDAPLGDARADAAPTDAGARDAAEAGAYVTLYDTNAQALYYDGSYGPFTGVVSVDYVLADVDVTLDFWHGHGGELHRWTLTRADLAELRKLRRVTIETTEVEGHAHTLFVDPVGLQWRVPGAPPVRVPV